MMIGKSGIGRFPKAALMGAGFAAVLVCGFSVPVLAQGADGVPLAVEDDSNDLDVPFVPSHGNVVKTMFDFAKPTKDDFIIDLGSGDGRIVITAAKDYGAQGFGVDLNAGLVAIANARAKRAGVADRAKFFVRDLFKTDLSKATIITMYLLPEVVMELRPKLAALRPGTRIVSHDYHLGSWRPDGAKVVDIGEKDEESVLYYWVVPARVSGTWQWRLDDRRIWEKPIAVTMDLRQSFRDVTGDAEIDSQVNTVHDATLRANRIAFSLTGEVEDRILRQDYSGVVTDGMIVGTVRLSGGLRETMLPWRARLVAPARN